MITDRENRRLGSKAEAEVIVPVGGGIVVAVGHAEVRSISVVPAAATIRTVRALDI
ncbi:MAG: hypothetical protein HDS65_01590 [Bacteroidales bacterium]|nr:hypothetical protein [Bacteroidales bacterium]